MTPLYTLLPAICRCISARTPNNHAKVTQLPAITPMRGDLPDASIISLVPEAYAHPNVSSDTLLRTLNMLRYPGAVDLNHLKVS